MEENGWTWSKPFSVNTDGTHDIDLANTSSDIFISINVSSLSASQKLITFTGQLILANQMVDSFEMKLVKYDATAKNNTILSRETFFVRGNSQPASVVLSDSGSMAMRLRFASVANLSWTGDIPLQPNSRWGQPWLVKGERVE